VTGPAPGRVAVALEYDRKGAPRVTAKGKGVVAATIIEKAREHGVPLQENADLAQALSQVPLDDEIPVELYKAVAQVIGFILQAAGRNRPPG
jgi:flagellar biosynthesis protein